MTNFDILTEFQVIGQECNRWYGIIIAQHVNHQLYTSEGKDVSAIQVIDRLHEISKALQPYPPYAFDLFH